MKTDDEGPNGTAFYDEEELGGDDFIISFIYRRILSRGMNEEALVACVLKSTSSTTLDSEGGLDVGFDTGC